MTLSEDGCLQQLNLRYNINTKINDILSTITTFGSVSIETSLPSVVIKTMKAKQAQIMSVSFCFCRVEVYYLYSTVC
jgi:hypothetical protein